MNSGELSELTLLVLRFGFLLLLWLFVFGIVYALRSDLFGQRVRKLNSDAAASPFPKSQTPITRPPAQQSSPTAPTAAVMQSPPASTLGPVAGPAYASQTYADQRSDDHVKATLLTAGRLVITSGPRAGTELPLGREPLTIGRSSESGLVIRDDYTSTHHARLLLWNNEWMIQDLDSTNGTFLDGKRVSVPTPIPMNTPIKIGTTSFELRR